MSTRPTTKERFPDRIVRFFDEHPVYVKAYVPVMVTISVAVQIFTGCN